MSASLSLSLSLRIGPLLSASLVELVIDSKERASEWVGAAYLCDRSSRAGRSVGRHEHLQPTLPRP